MENPAESGHSTRFKPGHRLSVGNRGGRPRKALTEKLNRYAEFALDALYRKASDENDPDRFQAMRELARLTTPRRREVTGESGDDLGLRLSVEAFRKIAETARAAGTEDHAAKGATDAARFHDQPVS